MCVSVCLPVCLFVLVFVWLYVHVCLSVCLSVCLCVCVCYSCFILRLSQFNVVITTYGVVGSEGAAYLPAEVQKTENNFTFKCHHYRTILVKSQREKRLITLYLKLSGIGSSWMKAIPSRILKRMHQWEYVVYHQVCYLLCVIVYFIRVDESLLLYAYIQPTGGY